MRSVRNPFPLATIIVLVFGLGACAPPSEEVDTDALQAEAWAEVQQAKKHLDAKRQELNDLRDAEEGESGETDTATGESESESLEDKATVLETEVTELTDAFGSQLTEFINSQDLYEGQEFTDVQRAAFNMKAQEDVLVAQEYIDKAGNYPEAIRILNNSLLNDPENELLLEAKAKAEDLRFMTEERFAAAKKGMTEDQVREILGTPQPIYVRCLLRGAEARSGDCRQYEDRARGVTAWFYPKAEPETAAGVYFKEHRGKLKADSLEFNAVKAEKKDEDTGG